MKFRLRKCVGSGDFITLKPIRNYWTATEYCRKYRNGSILAQQYTALAQCPFLFFFVIEQCFAAQFDHKLTITNKTVANRMIRSCRN